MDDTTYAVPGPEAGPKKLFDDCMLLLASVRSSLADLLREVREGNGDTLRQLVLTQAELEIALRRAIETEQRFNVWNEKNAVTAKDAAKGGTRAGGDEIDLDAVRYDIGCRLARLRACCHTD